jgi:RNA polymerase sigma-70 factor (TIGR02943 family)
MTSTEVQPDDTTPGISVDPRTWFERHGDYLYRFAVARVRRADLAEDLVQETLLAAWKARAEFNGQSTERTWLTAILKRKAIDSLRRRVREQTHLATTDRFADDLFDRRGEWKTSPGRWDRGDSVETVNRDEFWATLHACLDKLPERLHDVFVLRYMDEVAGDEVCRELGLTPSNLYVMLHRARLRMWWCLSKNWFGEEPQRGGREP